MDGIMNTTFSPVGTGVELLECESPGGSEGCARSAWDWMGGRQTGTYYTCKPCAEDGREGRRGLRKGHKGQGGKREEVGKEGAVWELPLWLRRLRT